MTSTNRFLNRLFLIVAGLITLAVGLALVLVALPAGSSARDMVGQWQRDQSQAVANTPITGFSWIHGSYLPWLLAVLCLIVVIVALVAVARRGGGRTDRVLEADDQAGRIVVASRFAESAIEDALEARRDVASVNVSSYRLKRAAALKVRIRVTAGSAPGPVVEAASGVVTGLDRVLGGGSRIPVLLEVVGASPVRPGADSRVH